LGPPTLVHGVAGGPVGLEGFAGGFAGGPWPKLFAAIVLSRIEPRLIVIVKLPFTHRGDGFVRVLVETINRHMFAGHES